MSRSKSTSHKKRTIGVELGKSLTIVLEDMENCIEYINFKSTFVQIFSRWLIETSNSELVSDWLATVIQMQLWNKTKDKAEANVHS